MTASPLTPSAGRQPLVTVVTATLGRRPQMLADAVRSVQAQTFTGWEHLIVDDGSFSVPDIDGTTVLRITHRGLGPARNAAVEAARSQAIALIDDDDLWHPDHLELVWAELNRSGADVVYADCAEVGRRDGYAIEVRDFDGALLERENFICGLTALVRTTSLRAAGGFPAGPSEDWALWRRMHALGMRFAHLPRITGTYCFHDDNLTYGGVDPQRTRRAKELRDAAERGKISWADYTVEVERIWAP